ncbi:MAG: site-specific integrase [Promicromonosporaceae bacterium]|nr:site-specific integrase [Promicromonosporaceae bacterium]
MAHTPEQRIGKDGVTWRVRFRLDGRQQSRTYALESGARRFGELIDKLGAADAVRIADARAKAASAEAPTVAQMCGAHIAALSGVEDSTMNRYRAYVRNDLGFLADMPSDVVEDTDIARWVNEMAAEREDGTKAAGKTIANKHGFLYAAFQRAVGKTVKVNPCEHTRLPRTETEDMVFLTYDEMVTFRKYVTPHWRPLVTCLFLTGLRWGEITALQVRDVDLTARRISVVRAWKKDRKLGPPKTKKSRRPVAIPAEAVPLLEPLLKGRARTEFVFLNMVDGPVRHQTFHDNVWTPAVRLANGEDAQRDGAKRIGRRRDEHGNEIKPATEPLGKRPRIHDARHSNASWLLGRGVPISVVQAHLGHESITTTVDRYGHLLPGAHDAIATALDGLATSEPEAPAAGENAAA